MTRILIPSNSKTFWRLAYMNSNVSTFEFQKVPFIDMEWSDTMTRNESPVDDAVVLGSTEITRARKTASL